MAKGEVKSAIVNLRIPESVHNRLLAAAERAGVNKSVWTLEALKWALEQDETALVHIPKPVRAAMPKRYGSRVAMPQGRVFGA